MKELDDFTVERLERIAERRSGIMPTMREIAALARIALAAKTIQPLRVEIQMDDANLMRRFEEMTKWRSPAEPILMPALESNSPELPDGWIPCAERMPEVEEEYYLAYSGGITDIAFFFDGHFVDPYITHWMPLPAPPTTEK
ncbi:DUF551 domain-containing protein [Serratia fonticola]|uniref:DUF551 domain-containing protein n=1 Tax=Serratia fonticola TaxID=47917 RepID=UPI00093952DF|nr:DUF551 domain-containing protein [Serratia fonticola]OKP29776.1 hypothetical protein BSQ40_08065 [Serratia fonticola]